MLIDELLQIRLCNELRRRVPDKFAAELKLAHAEIVLSFRAKSRNPGVGNPRVRPRDSSTPLHYAQNDRSGCPRANHQQIEISFLMKKTLAHQLADYACALQFEDLSKEVVHEVKRR